MDVHGFFTHRRLRLLSGLVMLAYITIHLLNHALGIISLAWRKVAYALKWRSGGPQL